MKLCSEPYEVAGHILGVCDLEKGHRGPHMLRLWWGDEPMCDTPEDE